jgi:two-component system, NtrC family, sensor kinase
MVDRQWVQIIIADHGSGMTELVRQKIFNPFFTTKPVGQGTGMGILISDQIVVDQHGGKLDCCSTVGQGKEFMIQIPVKRSACHAISSVSDAWSV